MTSLLEMKEHLKSFYAKFEVYLTPLFKFILAFITLMVINFKIGYMLRLKNPAIVLIVSLMCSFLPVNMIIVFAAIFIVLHVYSLSLECAIVVLGLFLLMFLLYFRFSPKDALGVLFTPICFALNIPYVVPLGAGFVGGPLSFIAVSCGVVVYYVLDYIKINSAALGNLEADSAVQKFKYVVDNLINNKTMMIMVVAFSATAVIVYFIKRLSTDHSWKIAMIAGALTNVVVVMLGDLMLDINISIIGIIFGMAVSVLLIVVLQFFVFSVDYTRTEYVQFEDDEYYYYVKAVPKMMVATTEKKVKRINPQKKNTSAERIVKSNVQKSTAQKTNVQRANVQGANTTPRSLTATRKTAATGRAPQMNTETRRMAPVHQKSSYEDE